MNIHICFSLTCEWVCLGYKIRSAVFWAGGNIYLWLYKTMLSYFPKQLYQFIALWTLDKSSQCSTSLLLLDTSVTILL